MCLLGSLKFKEIPGAKDRIKRYKEVKADIAGDIVLCLIRAAGNGLQHSPGEMLSESFAEHLEGGYQTSLTLRHRLARPCVHDVCSVQCPREVSRSFLSVTVMTVLIGMAL